MLILKIFVILIFLSIIASLFLALYHLIKNKKSSPRTVRSLTYRIGISLTLFICLSIAYISGYIQPKGLGMQMHLVKQQQKNNTDTTTESTTNNKTP